MRNPMILLAFLAACSSFEPTLLDFETTVPALREVGGLAATATGFLVVGVVPEAEPAKSDYATVTVGDDGRESRVRAFAARPHSEEQVSGVLPLADGWLVFGHSGSDVRGLRLDRTGAQIWEGVLGTGEVVRAAARSADGRQIAVVGRKHEADLQHLWVAVFAQESEGLALVAEFLHREAGSTEGFAIAPRVGGGFLVGGVRADEYPLLLRLDAELAAENLHPRADRHGRVSALLALADGRHLLAGVEADQGAFGLFDEAAPAAWSPRLFCAGSGQPTRPVALAYADGQVRIAGGLGYTRPTLWLYATDLTGESATMRTLGTLTDAGAARIGLVFSAAGGVALASTLCDGDPCVGVPTLWHMDPDGSGFGDVVDAECP